MLPNLEVICSCSSRPTYGGVLGVVLGVLLVLRSLMGVRMAVSRMAVLIVLTSERTIRTLE